MEQYNYKNYGVANQSTIPTPTVPSQIVVSGQKLDPRLANANITFVVPVAPVIERLPPPPALVESDSTQFINTWLREKGKVVSNNISTTARRSNKFISINLAKKSLRYCMEIVAKMNKTQEELRANAETMASVEWKRKSAQIGSLRDEFDKLMTKFEDAESLSLLKLAIKRRAKKRLNQKKRRKIDKELAVQRQENRLLAHKKIDLWLESKSEGTEKLKTEEKLKKDADSVLAEVSKKKADARKQLALISALVKLRSVRDNMALQRGEKVSLEDRKAFALVTENLVRIWESSLENYDIEEHNLKLMLEHNAIEDSEVTQASQVAEAKKITQDWENVLFGDEPNAEQKNNPTYWALTSADRDMETFIAIRKSWDTFLTKTGGVGSSIPVGWILPPLNASNKWKQYSA